MIAVIACRKLKSSCIVPISTLSDLCADIECDTVDSIATCAIMHQYGNEPFASVGEPYCACSSNIYTGPTCSIGRHRTYSLTQVM